MKIEAWWELRDQLITFSIVETKDYPGRNPVGEFDASILVEDDRHGLSSVGSGTQIEG